MSDKENEAINMTKSEEFQTFSKNYKNTNKEDKNQISLNKDNFEFTFKKNLFNEINKNNNNENSIEEFTFDDNEKNQKIKAILYENNKYKENKKIFKALFQKNKTKPLEKNNIKTVIYTNNEKSHKSINEYNNKNSKIILRNKLGKNINNHIRIDNNSAIFNQKKDHHTHLIRKYTTKYKNNDNSKNKSITNNKNNSFICQVNKTSLFNNNNNHFYITSYKSKINIKRKMSIQKININSEQNKNNYNPSHGNIKSQPPKNISLNNINNNKKEENKKNHNKSALNIFEEKKKMINKKDNEIVIFNNNNQKNIYKSKKDKESFSYKNKINNNHIKENNNKNNQLNYYAYSNLNKNRMYYNNKSSSIIVKKNKTLINNIIFIYKR